MLGVKGDIPKRFVFGFSPRICLILRASVLALQVVFYYLRHMGGPAIIAVLALMYSSSEVTLIFFLS